MGEKMRKPDFNNILKILCCETPDRPTLFEYFMNEPLYERLNGGRPFPKEDDLQQLRFTMEAFAAAGYDYVHSLASDFIFPVREHSQKNTISLNASAVITDRDSFNAYSWPDPDNFDYSRLEKIAPYLPDGMKIMVSADSGVLESVVALVGFENLCLMLYDDPHLTQDIFDEVGSRLLRYYEIAAKYETVGMLISNDDWGFKTQTFLSRADMQKYVYPWHKKIVDIIHSSGKPALLHSCGSLGEVMDDIIEYLHYDGKHSYEDTITPVEDYYEKYCGRIAVLGGIDMNFMVKSTPEQVRERCRAMLKRVEGRGGYALGTGNSVPEYIPQENYFAMIGTAME